MIPYGKQDISQGDIDAVVSVLKSDYLTQGPQVPLFEQNICKVTGAKYAVAGNSATSMLHAACLALGVGQGDVVWTSPITFVASANCALYCGADIDFVDIDPATANMCPLALAEKLAEAKIKGCLPKVIIPVHMAGHSCDMQAISRLAKQYDVRVIEDAAHAIGGSYQDHTIGSCHFSDITVFSFHPVKIITTAEGGVATTNDPELAKRLVRFRSHGITKTPSEMLRPDEGGWYYEQHDLGFNFRMTDLQASLGNNQIKLLDKNTKKRNQLAERYMHAFKSHCLESLTPLVNSYSAYHLFIIQLPEQLDRKHIFQMMRLAGICVHVHYYPVYLQPYFLKLGFDTGICSNAEAYYQNCLTLPLFPSLNENEQDFIIQTLVQLIRNNQ